MTRPSTSSGITIPAEENALCAGEIALGADGKAPGAVKLLPFGDPFHGRDGRGPYVLRDRAHAERVIAATRKFNGDTDMMIDYDHQSALAAVAGVGGTAKASAWIKGLEVRDDGIWASQVEWTPAAEAALAAREYRYLSPNFRVATESREVTRIVNAGLTNSPNLELPALASQEPGATSGEAMKTIALATLAALLSLDAGTATEALVLAAIDQLKSDGAANVAALAAIAKDLGLPDDAGSEAVLAAVATARKSGAPDPAKFVPKQGYDDLAARLAKIEEDRVLASVDAAVVAGKIAPSMKDWAIGLGKSDEQALAAFIAKAPAFDGAAQLKGDPTPEKGKLTQEEKAICSMAGVSEADFLKTRDEEAA